MKNIIFQTPSDCFCVTLLDGQCYQDFGELVGDRIPQVGKAYFTHASRIIQDAGAIECLPDLATVLVSYRLCGGKGGFANLMKNQAAKRKKQTNFDSSRDLQGRRIRNVQYEQKLVEFYKKQKIEDEQVNKALEDYKKVEATIRQGKVSDKLDLKYKEKVDKIEKSMLSCVREGIKNQLKRRHEQLPELEDEEGRLPATKGNGVGDNIQKCLVIEDLQGEKIAAVQESQHKEFFEERKIAEVKGTQVSLQVTEGESDQKNIETEVGQTTTLEHVDLQNSATKPAEQQTPVEKVFEAINLLKIENVEALIQLGGEHLRAELIRLGLKSGGTTQDKAQRLWAIKQDPCNLLNPKFLAKPVSRK